MKARFAAPSDLNQYAGYIFDCDGTLADTMPAHHIAWKRALAEGGAAFDFNWSVFVSRAGMSMERTVEELSEQFQVTLDPDSVSRRQRELFRELSVNISGVGEVIDFAKQLAGRRPIAVASGSSRPEVERTLSTVGARDLFDVIITPEDVVHGKPAPDMFLLAAAKMGVAPSACLVIEDGELGFEAARRAGMDYLVVDGPEPDREAQPSI
jgi:HAD superfamily hydrolase (TIGR01509 family)